MNKPLLFLRENPETIVRQCINRMEKKGGKLPGDGRKYPGMVRTLVETLADSVETMDPERFMGVLDAFKRTAAQKNDPLCLAGVIAAMEDMATEWEIDAEHTRFLWALFHKARMKSAPTGSEGTGHPSGEAVLLALKEEIEERKRTESELRESESRFRDVAECIPQIVFEVDTNYTVTFANRQSYDMYGYTPDDLQAGISCFDLIHPGDFPGVKEALQRIAGGGPSTGAEYRAVRKDGSSFPVISHAAPIMKDGRFAGWRGVTFDITERKKAEEELRESKRFLQDIADHIPGIIFQFYARPNGQMGLSYLSGYSHEIFGVSAGLSDAFERFLEGLTPSSAECLLESVRKAVAEEGNWRFEGEFNKPCGEIMRFVAMSSPTRNGDTVTFNGVLLDVTDHKRVEEELRESERKFRDIAELSPQVIFEENTDGLVTFANKQGLELFGYSEEDLQNGTITVAGLFPEHEHARVRENLAKAVAGERGTTGYEYRAQRKDGTTFPAIIYTAAIFRDDKLAGFRGVLVDITQMKDTDKELREREHRFRDLAESMPQVIFEMDEKGVITFANKQAFEIFGYDERDLSGGIEAFSLFSTEELPKLRANLQKIAEGGTSAGNEYNAVRKDGSSFSVIIHVARIMKEDRLTGFRGIIVDITERKKAEEELRENRRFMQDIADRIPGAVYQFYAGPHGELGLSYISGSSKELFGIDMDTPDAFGTFLTGLAPSCKERFLDSIRGAIEKECDWEFEGEFEKPSGETIAFAGMSKPVRIGDILTFNGVLLDITARKRAEKKLKESERKFRDIAELMPQVIFEIDEKGAVVFVNKPAFEFFGYKEDDLPEGFNCFTHIAPEEFPRMMANLQKIAEGDRTTGNEYTAIRKDGSRFSVSIFVTRIMNDGRLTGYRGIIIDVTERKKAEEELRRAHKELDDRNSFLDALLAAIPTPVFYKDRDGRYLGCNRAFTDQTGFTSEEMKGKTAFDIWPGEHASFFQLKDREIMETGQPQVFEWKIRDRSGSDCFIIFYKNVYRYADGTVAGVVGSSMDITERTRAEEALKQGEQRLRQIIDLVPHFIFAKDIDGRFILANKAVADTYGTTVDNLIGKVDARFTPSPEQVEHFRNDDLEVMTRGTTKYIPDEPITDSAGNVRYLETVKIPFTFSGTQTPAVLGVSVDITERKRTERKIAESEQELRTIISASPIGIGRTRNRILEWKNDAMCRITGYAFDDPGGKDARNLYQDPSEFERIGETLYRDGQAETKWVTKNGEVRDVLLQASPMDGDAYIYTASDITRLRHAENTLKFTQFSVDRAGDSVYWVDESGAIVYVNDSACLATGYDRHELLSMTVHEIDQGHPLSGWPQFWKEIVRKGSDQFESTQRRKDGTIFPVEVSLGYLSYNEFQYVCAFTRDVTERRKAEEALRNSEERWQFALEGSGDGLWDWNTLTGRVYFSKQWKEMIGYAEDEIGDTIDEWNRRVHPDDRERVHAQLDRHLEDRSPVYISQHRLRCKDGTYRWILDRGKVITRDEDGRPLRIIGTHTDITEHKKTEERLRLDERRTDALLKLNQMADRPLNEITDFTIEESIRLTGSTLGYLAFLNEDESVATMHSWSKKAMEQCRVRNQSVSYPIETTGLWGDPVRRRRAIITNNYAAPDTVRKGFPKGHVTVNRHLGVPLFDGENIVALIGVGNKDDEYGERDINQLRVMAEGMLRLLKQKTAQEALSISESRLRAVIDSAKDAIFIKDRDHRYVVANSAMSELFGIPMKGITGRLDRELFMDEAASHIETVDARVLQGETIEEEMPRSIGSSTHIFHTIKVPLRNNRGEIAGLCGIARDITERKHLESQLLQSQKMEAVGTLAGGVAHDFNNLLSAIMGYASLLQMKMEKDNPLYTYASQILVSSEKAANLTHSLLAFSRKQVINLKPVVINDTVDKLHRLLERLIPEDVEFGITRNAERLITMADPGQLDQVIMNLVTNARDAMPRGGKLTISIDRVAIDDDFIMARGYGKPGDYALIAVTDTGIGMDAKTAAKIFEPFFTTKGVGRGTGLGLAIVYGIIKQHNGYIDVSTRPGEGSTFSVYLPLVWLEPADEEAAPAITGGTETILIAEDNRELCELSVKVLEDHGYKVLAAKDGSLAVEAFREHKGDISLVILDVVMPKMNGKEACEAIRELDPSMKVIFTSGYTDDIIEQKGVNDRYDFLGKPITPATLLKKIREVLDRQD